MFRKFFSVIALISFLFFTSMYTSASSKENHLYNDSPNDMLGILNQYAAQKNIKLFGKVKTTIMPGYEIITMNYGKSETNFISISTVFGYVINVELYCKPMCTEIEDFLHLILLLSGVSEDEFYKFKMEYVNYYSKIALKQKVSVSELSKTFKIKCKLENKKIYIRSSMGFDDKNIQSLYLIISTNNSW